MIGQKEDKDPEYPLKNDLNVPKRLSTAFALASFCIYSAFQKYSLLISSVSS